ncbi:ATP-binding cassette sub-family G member 4 [Diabrotica virgifera virgifera]|nr:ATP-binding cassette sub-family G member 4 [Diabrotica virgifera virgifera]
MEAVLHESTFVGQSKDAAAVVKSNGVNGDSVNFSVKVNLNQEKTLICDDGTNGKMCQNTVDLEFQNISFRATQGNIFTKRTTKEILHQVGGRFQPGQLIAIMGPSGAGKSTLLDVLSGYRIRGVTGSVYVNGQPRSLKEFRKTSCYITQDDRLQPLLTVDENMWVAADLKLPSSVSNSNKRSIINNILKTLNLENTKKVRAAGLSGGQKKRLSIALELVNNPMVMFLDEPTTGLDSSSCSTCITLLKKLTMQGKTIICTIHQPSATLFAMFDQVYVVGNGYCLYQGSTNKLVPFLQDCGFPCPQYHNPADYVIELACIEHGPEKPEYMRDIIQNGQSYQYFNEPEKMKSTICNYPGPKPIKRVVSSDESSFPTSQFHQLGVLMRRGFIKAYRDKMLTYLRIGTNIIVGLMLGSLYWKAGSDGSKVLDNFNLLFAILLHHMMSTMMLTILTFPQEMSILIKEHFNRWYSLKMYYTSVTIVDIPVSVIGCFLFSLIIYYMTDQPNDKARFLIFFVTCMLVVLVAQGVGLTIGAYFDVVNGTFVGPTLMVPMMMFSGFGVRLRDLPTIMYYGSFTSYLRYGLEGVVQAVYGMDRGILQCPEDKFCFYKYPKTFLEIVDVRSDQFDNDIIALLLFLFVLRIAAYVVLRYKLASVR